MELASIFLVRNTMPKKPPKWVWKYLNAYSFGSSKADEVDAMIKVKKIDDEIKAMHLKMNDKARAAMALGGLGGIELLKEADDIGKAIYRLIAIRDVAQFHVRLLSGEYKTEEEADDAYAAILTHAKEIDLHGTGKSIEDEVKDRLHWIPPPKVFRSEYQDPKRDEGEQFMRRMREIKGKTRREQTEEVAGLPFTIPTLPDYAFQATIELDIDHVDKADSNDPSVDTAKEQKFASNDTSRLVGTQDPIISVDGTSPIHNNSDMMDGSQPPQNETDTFWSEIAALMEEGEAVVVPVQEGVQTIVPSKIREENVEDIENTFVDLAGGEMSEGRRLRWMERVERRKQREKRRAERAAMRQAGTELTESQKATIRLERIKRKVAKETRHIEMEERNERRRKWRRENEAKLPPPLPPRPEKRKIEQLIAAQPPPIPPKKAKKSIKETQEKKNVSHAALLKKALQKQSTAIPVKEIPETKKISAAEVKAASIKPMNIPVSMIPKSVPQIKTTHPEWTKALKAKVDKIKKGELKEVNWSKKSGSFPYFWPGFPMSVVVKIGGEDRKFGSIMDAYWAAILKEFRPEIAHDYMEIPEKKRVEETGKGLTGSRKLTIELLKTSKGYATRTAENHWREIVKEIKAKDNAMELFGVALISSLKQNPHFSKLLSETKGLPLSGSKSLEAVPFISDKMSDILMHTRDVDVAK